MPTAALTILSAITTPLIVFCSIAVGAVRTVVADASFLGLAGLLRQLSRVRLSVDSLARPRVPMAQLHDIFLHVVGVSIDATILQIVGMQLHVAKRGARHLSNRFPDGCAIRHMRIQFIRLHWQWWL